MSTSISSTSLDFANIRNNLKTYFAQKDEFSDYNFDASGLANLLDVLAYNTHYNGLIANMATNESFLSTAQLRSSVIAHAESLGVNVRSKTAAVAEFKASVNLSVESSRPSRLTLPIGTLFTASDEEGAYTFRTQEKYFATDDGTGTYVFEDIHGVQTVKAYEGDEFSKTFYVGEVADKQVYVIPELDMDTSTAVVNVYDAPNSSTFDEYTPLYQAVTVNSESTYYTLRESPNGYYELNFGDGVTFGKRPEAGSKIVVTYLVPAGSAANNLGTFDTDYKVEINGTDFDLSLVRKSRSYGGAEKQSLESIKQTAPVAFATQQRLVTASDYEALIKTNYSIIEDVSAWGGEDNIPLDYGSIYISLDYEDNTSSSAKTSTEQNIVENLTDNLSIMSITPKFIAPEDFFFNIECDIQFNPEKTSATSSSLSNNVLSIIRNHFLNKLNGFKKTFRKSNILTEIDSYSDAILSSAIRVKTQLRLTPFINTKTNYKIYFPMPIMIPDDDNYSVSSTLFKLDNSNKFARFQNKLQSEIMQVVAQDGEVLIDNAGFFDSASGRIELYAINVSQIFDAVDFIKIIATPADQNTIRPMKNYTMKLDNSLTFISSNIDRNQSLSRI